MKKILVPFDFSETSENAIEFAQKISGPLNGVIKLLHVYHPTPVETNGITYLDPEIESVKRARLESYATKLNETWIGDDLQMSLIDSEFKKGLAADEIIAFSEEQDDALIVMGNTGSSGSLKKLFGSVSTKVARHAKCPVLLVPSNCDCLDIKHIAYLSEDSELDAVILPKLIELAKVFDAHITIVHYDEGDNYDAEKLMNMWAQFYPTEKLSLKRIEGSAQLNSISEFSQNANVDLLAMSTKQRNVWESLFHDSLTKRMAINTKIPLYILHKA